MIDCPNPKASPKVLIAHGGGGRLTQKLLREIFLKEFKNVQSDYDAAELRSSSGRLAFTTDSFVVSPLFFPGGNIGTLAVNGTVNDLAMAGSKPLALSASFILEEGTLLSVVESVVCSMARQCREVGVSLVTGDTKVVERGKGDGIFITTSGIGEVVAPQRVGPEWITPGDAVLISGDIGRHGMAILLAREGLTFSSPIVSDCAPLWEPIKILLEAGIKIHCLRDLTRGGLATCLIELAEASSHRIEVLESKIPVTGEVRSACDLLGLDPIYVANEGRFIALVPAEQKERAIQLLHEHPLSKEATCIGFVKEGNGVIFETPFGTKRSIDLLSGELLPRIC